MTLHEKWEHINRRLRILDAADQEEEAGLLSEAYGNVGDDCCNQCKEQ